MRQWFFWVVSLSIVSFSISSANAQLRIVQYNAGDVKADTHTVLEQIGKENVNGIARPIDAILVEEQDNAASIANMTATLNSIYGAGTYVAAPYVGISSGGGLPGLVYRASSLSLVTTPVGVGTVDSSGNARQTIKYQLRPAGYGSSADVYLYGSHMKASSGGTNAARRAVEAQSNRSDADAMGSGRNIIYAGDFNLYNGSEQTFTTLTAAGAGRAVDPAHSPLAWTGSSNRVFHTQSPATVSAYGGQVLGGMNDRFDFELSSESMNDGHGVAVVPGSYRVFGNNGTHPLGGAINDAANTWNNAGLSIPRKDVLDALARASDHIPVVVDYQLPAKMTATMAAVPVRVITGAPVSVDVGVSNSANVSVAAGADVLAYNVAGSGAASGSFSGTAQATAAANHHLFAVSTASPGVKAGTISVNSSSESAATPSATGSFSTTVVAHATPRFASGATSESIDFGIVAKGSSALQSDVTIANVADASGFTAGLKLNSFSTHASSGAFGNTFAAQQVAAGASDSFSLSLLPTTIGDFSDQYALATSDEDLPGKLARDTLSLSVHAIVALGGDANLDGVVDISDLGILATSWQGSGTWTTGDFTRDGLVDISDLGMLTGNWQDAATLAGALASLGLPTSSIPEPSIGLIAISALALRRRNKAAA